MRRREPLPLRTLGLVACGAASGAVVRQAVTGLGDPGLAVAAINVVGALVLGLVNGLYAGHRPALIALVGTGFCGGLTTFSAVTVMVAGTPTTPEVWILLAVQVVGAIAAALLGWWCGRRLAPAGDGAGV
ncbi:CrcB family protein [Mariniluteicoccus flavus]